MWKTTINSLFDNFYRAIGSLLPYLQKAQIAYGIPEGYDAWESISENLYRHLIVEVIRSSLPNEERDYFELPRYEIMYENYREMSLIFVRCKKRFDKPCVFRNFSFKNKDLNGIDCVVIDNEYKPLVGNNGIYLLDFKDADFSLYYKSKKDARQEFKEIQCDIE